MTKKEILERLRAWDAVVYSHSEEGRTLMSALVKDLVADVQAEEAATGPEPEPRTFTLILPRGFRMLVVRED